MSSSAAGISAEQANALRVPIRCPLSPGTDGDDRVCRGQRRERLRRATAGVHHTLETTFEGAGCFASVDGYWRYLNAVAPLYAGLEATLEAAGALRLVPDWPCRRKLDLILAELHAAGGQTSCRISDCLEITAAPWCAGDVLGALYVLEGTTLGGAVLARRMRDLGPAPPPGTTFCFLDPYGAERGMVWRAFLNRLEAAELTRQEEEALCPRAAATFALFASVGNELACQQGSW